MPQRDLQKEREAIGSFGKKHGRMPDLEKPSEAAEVYNEAYPGGLPKELEQTVDASQQAAGLDTGQVGAPDVNLPQVESEYADTSGINKTVDALSKVQQRKQKWSQPNQFVDTLQQALREKTGMKEKPIGKSRIFEQAGVGGMGALQQSLSTRQQEMKINQTEFNNLVGEVAGMYQDQMRSLESQYESLNNIYEQQMDRLMQVERQARNFEQQKELLKMENAARKERIRLENGLEGGGGSGSGPTAESEISPARLQGAWNNFQKYNPDTDLSYEEFKRMDVSTVIPYAEDDKEDLIKSNVEEFISTYPGKEVGGVTNPYTGEKTYESEIKPTDESGYITPYFYNNIIKPHFTEDLKISSSSQLEQYLSDKFNPNKIKDYNLKSIKSKEDLQSLENLKNVLGQ